jgi:hypothetical protein
LGDLDIRSIEGRREHFTIGSSQRYRYFPDCFNHPSPSLPFVYDFPRGAAAFRTKVAGPATSSLASELHPPYLTSWTSPHRALVATTNPVSPRNLMSRAFENLPSFSLSPVELPIVLLHLCCD